MARSIDRRDSDVVVIGAGPYGLAAAAHLKARGVGVRVFGEPMSFWRRQMPKGMKLRSPWRATGIADPDKALSLDAYVSSRGLARVEPFPLEDFIGYGEWFQTGAVPDLDRRLVARIEVAGEGFRVITGDGEAMFAARVVMAAGLAGHQLRPAVFAAAPTALVSHTCDHDDLSVFRGKRVAVIGRGQSACETAALLSEQGAQAEIISRGPIRWLGAGKHAVGWRQELRSALADALAAPSAVGRFPLSWLVEVPGALRLLPTEMRTALSATTLRAAAAGWLRPRFGDVRVTAGVEIVGVDAKGDGVEIKYGAGDSAAFDRVVLATGYRFDVANLAMLAPELRGAIVCREGSPVLSAGFESSMPGLHFVGAAAVASLGPLMRFIAGTPFAARGLTRAIAANGPTRREERRAALNAT